MVVAAAAIFNLALGWETLAILGLIHFNIDLGIRRLVVFLCNHKITLREMTLSQLGQTIHLLEALSTLK